MKFIVAEISKNWFRMSIEDRAPETLISEEFEKIINVNYRRGYDLHSFQIHRVSPDHNSINETVIAVFEKKRMGESLTDILRS